MTSDKRIGRSVTVRINDRGPYATGRVIDLSPGAARVLGAIGPAQVSLQVNRRSSELHRAKLVAPTTGFAWTPTRGQASSAGRRRSGAKAFRPCGQSPGRGALIVFAARQTVKHPIKRHNPLNNIVGADRRHRRARVDQAHHAPRRRVRTLTRMPGNPRSHRSRRAPVAHRDRGLAAEVMCADTGVLPSRPDRRARPGGIAFG
jgi:hypothetical protein